MTTARSWGSEGPTAERSGEEPPARRAPPRRPESRIDSRRARRRRLRREQMLIGLILLGALIATVVLLAQRSQSQPVTPSSSLSTAYPVPVGGTQ